MNRIPQARRAYQRHAERSARTGAEVAADTARERCAVSPHAKEHLVDTIHVETRRTKTIHEAQTIAGDPASDAAPPAMVEFGTGREYERPSSADVEDAGALPATGRQTPWVYFNEYTGRFVTTTGNEPQPFMGPGYSAGREAMESAASRAPKF